MAATNNTSLLPEIGADGLPREAPIIVYTQKMIEQEQQLQLKKRNPWLIRLEDKHITAKLKTSLLLNYLLASLASTHGKDGKPLGPIETSLASDALSVPPSLAPVGTENIASHVIARNAPGAKYLNQQPPAEGEGEGKKKIMILVRGNGLGAVPKGRVPPTTG